MRTLGSTTGRERLSPGELPYPAKSSYRKARLRVTEQEPAVREAAGDAPLSVAAPVLGCIAAGAPILAEEHVIDVLTLPCQVVDSGELCVLAVASDSMAGNGSILDSDLVVVRRQPDAENGDFDGEATVKRFRGARRRHLAPLRHPGPGPDPWRWRHRAGQGDRRTAQPLNTQADASRTRTDLSPGRGRVRA
ncbi:LexA family protein [Streptomyces misionensis]|uniref:LexA family protein n=1 Tax=Streptomyces misionensis TaxID=67331 RepID=UPI003F4D8E66